MEKEKKAFIGSDAFYVILLYTVAFALHMLLTFTISKGTIVKNDTFRYMTYGHDWATTGTQSNYHYPLLYPLLLSIAYIFPDPLLAIRIINQVVCSSAIIFVYLTGRIFLNKRDSILLALVSLMMPYQFTIFSQTMSEVLFVPLLWVTIYYSVRPYREGAKLGNRIGNDILLAVLILSMYLTRFISLVVIPVFGMIWIMKQIENRTKIGEAVGRAVLIVAVMVGGWMPWYFICRNLGTDLKGAMGFGIANNPNPEQLTPENLCKVIILYICYYVLLAAPALIPVIKSLFTFDWKRFGCGYNRLFVAVHGIAAAFFVAVARHSYRAAYNYPTFYRVMGRYLIIFPIMYIMMAVVTVRERQRKEAEEGKIYKTDGLFADIIFAVLSIGMIVFSYLTDVEGMIYPIRDTFASWKASGDVYLINMYRYKWLAVIIAVQVLTFALMRLRNEKFSKYRITGGIAAAALCFVLFVPGYYNYFRGMYKELGLEYTEDLFKILGDVKDEVVGKKRRSVYYSISSNPVNTIYEEFCLKHYLLASYFHVESKTSGMKDETKTYVLVTESENAGKYDDKLVRVLGTYRRFDTECSVLLLKNKTAKK